MQRASKNYDCEEYGNDDGWNEPSGHGGYSCEVLGSSYSGDAPLGCTPVNNSIETNTTVAAAKTRRLRLPPPNTFISRWRRWRIETAHEGAHAAMIVKVCVQYPMVCIILLTAAERNPPGRRNAFRRRRPSAMDVSWLIDTVVPCGPLKISKIGRASCRERVCLYV